MQLSMSSFRSKGLNKRFFLIGCLITMFFLASCHFENKKADSLSYKKLDSLTFKVERAEKWTQLFKRDSGWFGGDGIFSIPYSGIDRNQERDSILFLFSDTMAGEIKGDSLQPGYKMVHNSVAGYHKGKPIDSIQFRVAQGSDGKVSTIFVPTAESAKRNNEYYWLGDGFVNTSLQDNLYLFAYRITDIEKKEAQFPFKQVGNDLIKIPVGSKFPYKDQQQLEIPFNNTLTDSLQVSFGSGILVNTSDAGEKKPDGYVYIYGTRSSNHNEVVCARVKPSEIENFTSWRFWNGKIWSGNPKDCARLSNYVSNELSVTSLPNGQYGLIYQYGGIYPSIYLQTGPTPVGPFGKRMELWDTSKDITDPDLYTYNAKAHPAISKPGELLVSYNVNSFKFFDIIEDKPHLYHPRFIRIKFSGNSKNSN